MSTNQPRNRQPDDHELEHVTVRLSRGLVRRIRERSPRGSLTEGLRVVAGAGVRATRPAPRKLAKGAPATKAELDAAKAFAESLAEGLGTDAAGALAALQENLDGVIAILARSAGQPSADAAEVAELTRLFETNLVAAGAPKGPETTAKAHRFAADHHAAKRAARKDSSR